MIRLWRSFFAKIANKCFIIHSLHLPSFRFWLSASVFRGFLFHNTTSTIWTVVVMVEIIQIRRCVPQSALTAPCLLPFLDDLSILIVEYMAFFPCSNLPRSLKFVHVSPSSGNSISEKSGSTLIMIPAKSRSFSICSCHVVSSFPTDCMISDTC